MRWLSTRTFDPNAERGSAVLVANDEFLGHVDQTTGEVTGVGGTQSGVDQSLTRTGGGDEVLERFESLAEVPLDGTRNHVTTRVGHQTAHTGDLTHLGHVSART